MSRVFLMAYIGFSIFFSSTVRADVLLVISSSGGMFSNDSKVNLAIEKVGSRFVGNNLRKKYRSVYTWEETSNADMEGLLRRIKTSLTPMEYIDVFSMKHGSGSFLEDVDDNLALQILGRGTIRNVYSTGCAEWGSLSASYDFKTFESQRQGYTGLLSQMGVQRSITHANDNYTGFVSIPLLVSSLRKNDDWFAGGIEAFQRTDDTLARLIRPLVGLENFFDKFGGYYFSFDDGIIWNAITSRPVFSGTLPIVQGINQNEILTLDLDPSTPDIRELLIFPTPIFQAAMKDIGCSNPFGQSCPGVDEESPLSRNAGDVLKIVGELFAVTSESGNGCLDPKILQPLVNATLLSKEGVAPQLVRLCFEADKSGNAVLTWSFGPTPQEKLLRQAGSVSRAPDLWIVMSDSLPGVFSEDVKSMTLDREGQARFVTSNKKLRIQISGLGLNFSNANLALRIPEGLLHFGVKGIEMTDLGDFKLKASAPLLNIPITGSGEPGMSSITKLKVLGIPFNVDF